MKNIRLSLFFTCLAYLLNAQQTIQLHIEPMLGANSFALNQITDAVGFSYQYKINRLEYYISEVKITHDGGQVTPLTDMYILARPATQSIHSLGTHNNIQNIEAITFSIGVDSLRNHNDPSALGTPQVLTPQVPEMHWGWAAGYRFLAIEGVAGPNFNQIFEIHALGDQNYKTLTLPVTAEQVDANTKMIHITADYAKILKDIEVSSGLILHGSNGGAAVAMNNMGVKVFSPTAVGVIAPTFDGQFNIAPNPAQSNLSYAKYALPSAGNYEITITDIFGRQVFRQALTNSDGTILLKNTDTAGTYFVHLWKGGNAVAYEKLIIAP